MALPSLTPKHGVVHIDGVDYPLRSLTARELTDLRGLTDAHDVNIGLIAHSFDVSVEDAAAWYEKLDASVCLAVLNAINIVSGLGEAAQFPGSAPDGAVDARPGV